MRLVWTPWAIPAIVALLFASAMAALVFLARPERAANRRLALQLAMEGYVVSVLAGLVWLIDDPDLVWGLTAAATFLVWPKLWAYFNFLATLPTPLARHFQPAWRLRAFLALSLLAGTTWFLWPELYYVSVVPVPWAAWAAVPGPGFFFIMQMWGVMWLIGLAFSISAVRHAPTPIAKRRAKAYLVAFGTRDVMFGALTVALTIIPPTSPYFLPVFMVFPLIWVVYVPLVGYGILKTQLFDIDVQIKRSIPRSFVAGALLAAFFLASEVASSLVEGRWGPIVGLGAAGALALAGRPLHRVGQRLSDRVMPGVADDERYRESRRAEVYRAALEGALEDGEVTDKERVMLARLRANLGIADAEGAALEADVRRTLHRGATPS